MQFFDRSTVEPPSVFRGDRASAMRRDLRDFMQQDAGRRSQDTPPPQLLGLGDEVVEALGRLFRMKCAFCESKNGFEIHRFRPAAEAQPYTQSAEAHLYYTWLATDWGNFYSICQMCNRHARNLFPVQEGRRGPLPTIEQLTAFAEENYGRWRWPHRDRPLLLDPCGTRDFSRHLSFDLSGGIRGLTKAGRETVEVFDLDRKDLQEARADSFERYLSMLSEEKLNLSAAVFDFRSMEFGGGWQLLLRRMIGRLQDRLGTPLEAGKSRIHRTLARVLLTPRGVAAFRATIEDIRHPVAVARRPPSKRRYTDPRRLVSVSVENFKSLERLSLQVPDPIAARPTDNSAPAEAASLLVLGENAAGKSSILEAVALALCGPAIRVRLSKAAEEYILDPELMGAEGAVRPPFAMVRLAFDGGDQLLLEIGDGFREHEAVEGMPTVFAYGAFRQYSERGKRVRGGGSVATLFSSDFVLRNPEEWLLKLNDGQFALVARALRLIFSIDDEKFDVLERDFRNNRCLIRREVGTGDEATIVRTPLSVASSGFRSVLAMVCDILEGIVGGPKSKLVPLSEARPVILIDEIEAHLHPRWKMRIMQALRRMLPGATFIVTTHDPLCLRGMHDQEVVVLRQVPKPVELAGGGVFVESVVDLPNVENLTIEQLLTSDLFDLFSTDAIETERRLAELGSLLALRDAGHRLSPEQDAVLHSVETEVLSALPIGSSKVERLVMDAVALYLKDRRSRSAEDPSEIEERTKRLIAEALAGYA